MMSTESETQVTINDHPVPERVWVDFRDEPANRYCRVYTAPNAFANVAYVRVQTTEPSDAANDAATEICDYCGIDSNDAEQVAAIIAKHSLSSTPADAEELVRLRAESLKGICVYCGEIQQYESLEQKASEEGNALRVAHIRQCPKRPELKLIDAMVALHEAASNALRFMQWQADPSAESYPKDLPQGYDVIAALRNALGTQRED